VLKITSNIYQISGAWGKAEVRGSNVFVLIDKQLTLVDTGFRGSAGRIIKIVEFLGYSPSDISNIILTHHHPDHMSSLAELKKITPARVMAHPADAPYINGQLSQPGPSEPDWLRVIVNPFRRLWATKPVKVDVLLQDEDELPVFDGIKVFHTPGHTLGSISLYLPGQRLVIVGDLVVHGDKIGLPSRAFTVDKNKERNSILRVSELNFDIMCFGHGPPIISEAHHYMKAFTQNLQPAF
jgi:glyoxylase-like metal-dependent hydrolase (beta-lactamase superfamily II)